MIGLKLKTLLSHKQTDLARRMEKILFKTFSKSDGVHIEYRDSRDLG